MPREATGELRTLSDGFAARITISGRTRRDFFLATCSTEPEAAERCRVLAGFAARLRRAGHADQIVKLVEMGAAAKAGRPWEAVVQAVDVLCAGNARDRATPAVPLYKDAAKSFYSNELAKKYPDHVREKSSADRDEELFRLHVLPHVPADLRIDEFSLEHAEFVMANLPAHLTTSTRRHVAQVMSRLMKLAVYPCKWRTSSPIPAGWLPRVPDGKAKECLYPDEDALLVGGVSVEPDKPGVPLLRRLAYGFLCREGMRTDEMARLKWRDVDLQRGRVHLDENKTDDPRDWNLRPDVVEALARWKARHQPDAESDHHVFAENGVPINVEHLADQLRRDLQRVGVTRPQLFERSKVRQPVRAHDLRATFVTISLATGKTETWISDRTGHHSHEMIERYRRKARTWNLGELGPLCELVPELRGVPSARIAPRIAPRKHRTGGEIGRRSGFRFRRREA